MLVALALVAAAERYRPPRVLVRAAVAVAFPLWFLWQAFLILFLGPYAYVPGVVSLAVVTVAGVRLWRPSTSEGAAGAAAGGRSGGSGGGGG